MTEHLEPMLTKLGYNRAWLEYGLIDEDLLQEQSVQFDTSDDQNTEHYRYAAFRNYLSESIALDDDAIDKYIHVAQLDEHHTMALAALILLAECPYLTGAQLSNLKEHPAFASPVAQHRIERMELLRLLQSAPTTDELFERCLASRDDFVQRELLERQDISRQQVQMLRDRGANRAIRNIAMQRLQRRS